MTSASVRISLSTEKKNGERDAAAGDRSKDTYVSFTFPPRKVFYPVSSVHTMLYPYSQLAC